MSAQNQERTVAVIGLGYVGLPLACAFGKVMPTIGYDVNVARIEGLRKGEDKNGEVTREELSASHLTFTAESQDLVTADVYIVAVPTPTDNAKRPDLRYLVSASETVGQAIAARAKSRPDSPTPIIVYESTVYPGCTEEDCVPAVEQASGLKNGSDFKVGYSPERINPGDKEHTFEKIMKVVSGQDDETLDVVASLYGSVVKAGVHRAPSIKVAEAAKVIENTQRDLNIALMNELALLFHSLGIDGREVLAAAKTKWNFIPFHPGLVGGHCIPEDPYYLTYAAERQGFDTTVISAGRRINDEMGVELANLFFKRMVLATKAKRPPKVLVLGMTFKPNVRDTRNSGVFPLVNELCQLGSRVEVYDPKADSNAYSTHANCIILEVPPDQGDYDGVILAVGHDEFRRLPAQRLLQLFANPKEGLLFELSQVLTSDVARRLTQEGIFLWRL